jgi:hypothetical protein
MPVWWAGADSPGGIHAAGHPAGIWRFLSRPDLGIGLGTGVLLGLGIGLLAGPHRHSNRAVRLCAAW